VSWEISLRPILLFPYAMECLAFLLASVGIYFICKYLILKCEVEALSRAAKSVLKDDLIIGRSKIKSSTGKALYSTLQSLRSVLLRTNRPQAFEATFNPSETNETLFNLEKLASELALSVAQQLATSPKAIRIYLRSADALRPLSVSGEKSERLSVLLEGLLVENLQRTKFVSQILSDDSLCGLGVTKQILLRLDLSLKAVGQPSELVIWIGFRKNSEFVGGHEEGVIASILKRAKLLISQAQEIERLQNEMNSERDHLLGISHDLRAPSISALYLLREAMGKTRESREQGGGTSDLGDIEVLLLEQLTLIQDFLDLERGKQFEVKVRTSEVNLSEIIRELSESPLVTTRSDNLSFQIQVKQDLTVLFDRSHLKRILFNLVSNALKFTTAGGVKVNLEISNGSAAIRIIDSGRGVPGEQLSKLFSRFERLGVDEEISGSGIGLSASKMLAELNGAALEYAPAAGGGSVFSLSLPSKLIAVSCKEDTSFDPLPLRPAYPVLILDDDDATCRLYQRLLQSLGISSKVESSVEGAVLRLSNEVFSALITDYRLPDGDCFKLVKILSQMGKQLPILVVSGITEWMNAPQKHLMEKVFGARFLEKPVERDEFCRLVCNLFHETEVEKVKEKANC